MAQGHGDNISLLCTACSAEAGGSERQQGREKKNQIVPECLSRVWLTSLFGQRKDGGRSDWLVLRASWWLCLFGFFFSFLCQSDFWLADVCVCVCVFFFLVIVMSLQTRPEFGLSAEEILHNNSDFFQLCFLCHSDSLLTRSIAATEVEAKQTFGKL